MAIFVTTCRRHWGVFRGRGRKRLRLAGASISEALLAPASYLDKAAAGLDLPTTGFGSSQFTGPSPLDALCPARESDIPVPGSRVRFTSRPGRNRANGRPSCRRSIFRPCRRTLVCNALLSSYCYTRGLGSGNVKISFVPFSCLFIGMEAHWTASPGWFHDLLLQDLCSKSVLTNPQFPFGRNKLSPSLTIFT